MTTPLPSITFLSIGAFRANSGQTVSLDDGDLRDIVASYDAKSNPAPVVIGTPGLADPAYGWVASLEADSGKLTAKLSNVDPTFAENVRGRRYTSLRPSFYLPDSSANPAPGRLYLKHISFEGMPKPKLEMGSASFAQSWNSGTLSFAAEVVEKPGMTDHYQQALNLMKRNPALKGDEAMAIVQRDPSLPAGYEADPERAALYRAAMDLRAGDPRLTMAEAVRLARGV